MPESDGGTTVATLPRKAEDVEMVWMRFLPPRERRLDDSGERLQGMKGYTACEGKRSDPDDTDTQRQLKHVDNKAVALSWTDGWQRRPKWFADRLLGQPDAVPFIQVRKDEPTAAEKREAMVGL